LSCQAVYIELLVPGIAPVRWKHTQNELIDCHTRASAVAILAKLAVARQLRREAV
jgi:hypothetical protein